MKLYSKSGLTGQELSDYLISIDFAVPAKIPMPVKDYPAWIAPPPRGANLDEYREAFTAYRDYMNERARQMQEYLDKKAAYNKQFTDFAAYLETIFIMQPESTTWLKVAERLIGKNGKPIKNPIYFIAFKEF
jgi:hypothetical protein